MLPCEPAPKGAWASSFRVLSLQDWSKGFAKTACEYQKVKTLRCKSYGVYSMNTPIHESCAAAESCQHNY